jgi:hypothetical protein
MGGDVMEEKGAPDTPDSGETDSEEDIHRVGSQLN